MSDPVTLDFRVNGAPVQASDDPDTPMLFVLRNVLGLKGSRLGCGAGQCGACTITLDGVPVTSCDLPFQAVAGKDIGTIEGIAEAGHPLIAAILKHQAGQCGYCLPGIITRTATLIDDGGSLAEIKTALDDNLCRCGVQNRILAAVAEVVTVRDGAA